MGEIVCLTERKAATLQRVRQSIREMQTQLKGMGSQNPSRVLVENVIRQLRKTEARLAGGLGRKRG